MTSTAARICRQLRRLDQRAPSRQGDRLAHQIEALDEHYEQTVRLAKNLLDDLHRGGCDILANGYSGELAQHVGWQPPEPPKPAPVKWEPQLGDIALVVWRPSDRHEQVTSKGLRIASGGRTLGWRISPAVAHHDVVRDGQVIRVERLHTIPESAIIGTRDGGLADLRVTATAAADGSSVTVEEVELVPLKSWGDFAVTHEMLFPGNPGRPQRFASDVDQPAPEPPRGAYTSCPPACRERASHHHRWCGNGVASRGPGWAPDTEQVWQYPKGI